MGKIFSLDNETRSTIKDVLDDILENVSVGGLGKTCLLVYPPKFVNCVNCIFDPVTNRSSNRSRSGAPSPFLQGSTCPLCSGTGKKESEVTEEVTLKCTWEIKAFAKVVPNIDTRIPYSFVKTKGHIEDLPKILKASYIIVNLPFAPYIRQKFKLYGQPGDPSNIVPGEYFNAFWETLN